MKALIYILVCGVSSLFAQPPPTVLKGGGVQISVDLTGFKEDLGVEKLKDNYFRLAQFSNLPADQEKLGGRLIGSILVDNVPVNSETKKPFSDPFEFGLMAALKQIPAPFLGPSPVSSGVFRIQKIETPAGVLLDFPDVYEIKGEKLYQHQIYFESIHNGKWLEFHFSVPSAKPTIDATPFVERAKSVISSMQFYPAASN